MYSVDYDLSTPSPSLYCCASASVMSGLLYRKSGSAQRRRVDSHFWPSGPQLLFNSPSAADSRPSTREGLFGLINAIEKHLAEVFSRSADRAAGVAPLGPPPAERARAGQAAVREVIVIDDDYSDSMPGADRRYSLKAAYDKQYVDRIAMSHSKLGLNPDESVQDRIDAMERQSAAEAAEDAMDVVQSAEEQVSLRLQELGGDMKASAVAFLNSSRTSKSAILIQKYDIPMSEFNLRCIAPGKWLNDEVINFYMGMLQEKDNALCAARTGRRPSHFFNLFFVSKLLEGGAYSYRNVKRWTKKIDIFEKDKIFCPVNIANTHWTMCVVHMTERRIQVTAGAGACRRPLLTYVYSHAVLRLYGRLGQDSAGCTYEVFKR